MTTNNIKHTDCLYLYLTGIKSYSSGRSLISIDLGKSSGGISINTNTANSFGVKDKLLIHLKSKKHIDLHRERL